MKPLVRNLLGVLVLAASCAHAGVDNPTPKSDVEVPDATLTLSGGVVALGIGYEWVHGALKYQGRTYTFRVQGFSIMDLGAAKISGIGEVFNLKSLADFDGYYAGTTFGSAVSHGGSLALIKNERGVTIKARSTLSGVRFSFSGNGMHIKLDPSPTAALLHLREVVS
jgi:hypothetical protein